MKSEAEKMLDAMKKYTDDMVKGKPLSEDMLNFLDSIGPKYEQIETDIDFSEFEAYDVSNSLHVFEAKYLVDGKRYRTMSAIGSEEYIVEIYIEDK